ncbi:VOC family protein [Paradevosia shaoguanensis]|uniref:VOC family protein n=1 Tax=Paradevosia shaoguanensis TaxID=1335043 RepID=UPI003C72CB04
MTVFDHAVVNVLGGMEEAVARYERLGFRLTPRGYHTLGSINHLAVFGSDYLELLGYAPGEREKRAELWEHPAGLTGLALRTQDAAGLHAAMAEAGAAVEACKDFSRPVEIGGVQHEAAFRTFQFDRKAVANGRIFFCQHKTPELIWRSEYQDHPNGVTGIAGAFVVTTGPSATPDMLAAAPGLAREAEGVVRAGNTCLRFAPAEAIAAHFGVRELPGLLGQNMRMVGLELRSRDIAQTAACLEAGGVPFERGAGWVQVDADEAAGLILRFVAQD